jgi:hypothetical protein
MTRWRDLGFMVGGGYDIYLIRRPLHPGIPDQEGD